MKSHLMNIVPCCKRQFPNHKKNHFTEKPFPFPFYRKTIIIRVTVDFYDSYEPHSSSQGYMYHIILEFVCDKCQTITDSVILAKIF